VNSIIVASTGTVLLTLILLVTTFVLCTRTQKPSTLPQTPDKLEDGKKLSKKSKKAEALKMNTNKVANPDSEDHATNSKDALLQN